MTRATFLNRLLGLAVAAAVVALLLRMFGGARWFSFYGPALAILAVLPILHRLLANRLAEHGRARRRAYLVTLPLALMAAVQIGYWLAFFCGSTNGAILIGVGRFVVRDTLGLLLPVFAIAFLAMAALAVARLAAEPGEEAGGE